MSEARTPKTDESETTPSGLEVKPVYEPADLPADLEVRIGEPGSYPYVRGIHPAMYRDRLWTMRQYGGFSSARESNRRFKLLLESGVTGLSVAFDLPTQIGYDSDHAMAEGEVGKVGVAVDTVEDVAELFEDIPLDRVSTSMTINATAPILLAMYTVVAQERGLDVSRLRGTIQNDILKEYAARGTYIFPIEPSMRLITDVFEWCTSEMPSWNTISVSGYHIREAGATAVEELAFTLANAVAYVDAARRRGLDVERFARRMSFFFSADSELFEEVAKFRAARRMWARLMVERFGVPPGAAATLRFHTQTAGSTLTSQQPDNNIVRVTLQALSAVLGGTQSLHTNAADEALSLPSDDAATTALRTQQIIAYESGVTRTADPLAGSFYVERLTQEVEDAAIALLERIESMGGSPKAIESGWMQERIARSAYRQQQEVEHGERVVVGVNRFSAAHDTSKRAAFRFPDVGAEQSARLQRRRAARDSGRVRSALEAVSTAARVSTNLMPPIREAVKARATVGEISDVLRSVWGEFKPR